MKTKKVSLLTKFVLFFSIFIIVTVLISGFATYRLQTRLYREHYQDLLAKVNGNIADEILADGEDFAFLQTWFREHYEELEIPFVYPDNARQEYSEFQKVFARKYPDRIMGEDIHFSELEPEVQKYYARYLYMHWLTTFDRMKKDYGLEYAYYVYPTEGQDEMCFMFDGPREEKVVNGKSLLLLGFVAHQDRTIHANMWKSYETGEVTGEMDGYANEYGHVYTYATPVNYNGKTLGVILTDVSYEFVLSRITRTVGIIVTMFMLILGISSAGMLSFIQRRILERITRLEQQVAVYTERKDPAMAEEIAKENTVNDEIGSLAGGFSGMITELHEYMDNLTAVTAEKERIGAELNVATQIQASMLPRIFPPFPERKEFSLFAAMDPAKEVGGDFYDFFMVDEHHIALIMADVSGKGVPAALFMAISKVLIKDSSQDLRDPASILVHVNDQLCEENDADLFVTVWLGIVDLSTGVLTFADAGHEYPVLLHADGELELVRPEKKRPPIATLVGIPYKNNTITLSVGDTLILYTDGVPEATNAQNELYGMNRLENVLRTMDYRDMKDVLQRIREDVDAFVGDAVQFDDLTMLAFHLEELES